MSGALAGQAIADLLREALKSGDTCPLAAAHAEDALLDLSVQGERSLLRGADAIAARLERLWPGRGRLVEWASAPGRNGCAVWSERVAQDGSATRQRQYLQLRDGAISRHWLFGAPPRTTAPRLLGAEAPALFERLCVTDRQPLVSTGWSGNRLERLRTADGQTLIAKRIKPSADWIGRNSGDPGREGLLYTEGLFERMPAAIDPAVVAAESEGDAWWVVGRDVSDRLLDADSPISREQNRRVLRAANSMWEEFWGERHDFLCDLAARIALARPQVAELERAAVDLLPKQFEAAWEAFAEAVQGDVAEPILALLDDPSPLVCKLEAHGTTLLHGDLRDEHIGFDDGTLVALDWGAATQGHPVLDLAWYMVHDVWRIDATHDEVVEDFRRARGERDDPRAVDLLGLLGAHDVRMDLRARRRDPHRPRRASLGARGARLVGSARPPLTRDLVALTRVPQRSRWTTCKRGAGVPGRPQYPDAAGARSESASDAWWSSQAGVCRRSSETPYRRTHCDSG